MKRIFCVAALFLAACGKPATSPSGGSGASTAAPSGGGGTPSAEPQPRVPKPLRPDPVLPRLYVTANDSDAPQIPAGWPMVLKVSVCAPGKEPLKLEAPSGSWASLVHLALPDAAWKPRALDFEARSITIDAATSGTLLWTMTPEELDAIPRGSYRISATIEVAGGARCQAATVKLVKALAKLTPEQDVERSRLLVTVLRARADAAGAEREADALLKRLPANSGAILLRVDLFEAAGKRADAEALLDKAIEAAVGGAPTAKNWPKDLARRREELAEKDRPK